MSNKSSEALLVLIRDFRERKALQFPEIKMKTDTDYEKYHILQYTQ